MSPTHGPGEEVEEGESKASPAAARDDLFVLGSRLQSTKTAPWQGDVEAVPKSLSEWPGPNTYAQADAAGFMLRCVPTRSGKKKAPSAPALYTMVGAECLASDKKVRTTLLYFEPRNFLYRTRVFSVANSHVHTLNYERSGCHTGT
jgi:hypothetical protein